MLWEVYRYFSKGWIKKFWIDPIFYFPYINIDFLHPLPGNGMYYLFALLGICAFFIAIGFLYRFSTVLFAIGFTYMFLLDKTHYLNHFYLIALISWAIIFIPANKNTSVDAFLWPNIRQQFVPRLNLFALQFLIGITYFFGGIAKLNWDWLRGEPISSWIARKKDFPIFGDYMDTALAANFFTYGGLAFDLCLIPLLIFKKTRWLGFVMMISFHLMNAQLFRIGIFPWMMLFVTFIFLIDERFNWIVAFKNGVKKQPHSASFKSIALTAFVAIMILLPFRHWLYPGNVSWTEEGHRFAWRMKLRDKDGKGTFFYKVAGDKKINPVLLNKFLTKKQAKSMLTHPDMILQFAKGLPNLLEVDVNDIVVRAQIENRLNGRDWQKFIQPDVDLSKLEFNQPASDFVLPLTKKLKPRNKKSG